MSSRKTVEAAAEIKLGRYRKDQLLEADRYRSRRDVLQVLLDQGRMYSFDEVDCIVEKYMKGKVM